MGDLVKADKYNECDVAGILKQKININDAYEKLIKQFESNNGIDKNFLSLAKERKNVNAKLVYHEVFYLTYNYDYYTKNYDLYDTEKVSKKITDDLHIVDVHTKTHHIDTITSEHKNEGAGFAFKDPFTHENVYITYYGNCFDLLNDRLGWEPRMFRFNSVFELDVASTKVNLISDCEYLNDSKDRFKADKSSLEKMAEKLAVEQNKASKNSATSSFIKSFNSICYLQPYYVFTFSFNGYSFSYYVNAFTTQIGKYTIPPLDGDVKKTLKENKKLTFLIKLPLLVCGLLNLLGWVIYIVKHSNPEADIAAMVFMVLCFAVIPVVLLGLFYFLWIDYNYSHKKETFRSLIKNNKKEFVKTIIAYIIALVAFVSAIIAFTIS